MPVQKLKQYLDEHKIKYVVITHSQAFTSMQVAASAHIPGKELAKTVMLKIGKNMAMAVLPASYRIDLETLKDVTGYDEVELATEAEFKDLFPDCETGAMPPFGNLYGMEVYVSKSLAEDEQIAFSAGSHRELIRMGYADFARLVKPKVAAFSI